MAEATRINQEYYEEDLAGRDDYWRHMAAPRFRVRALLRLIARHRPSCLVDLGCGGGRLLDEVARRFPEMELAGVDLASRLIERNRRDRPAVLWRTLDLGQPLTLPGELAEGFQMVVASEVIEHVDDPALFLCNARRFAAPDAVLLLTTQSGTVRETERRVGHVRHFSRREMEELLRRTGWSPERVWNTGLPFHDLSKWWANRNPDASMARFGARSYGLRERAICAALRLAFRLNSRTRGAQLFAVARRGTRGGGRGAPAPSSPDRATADAFAASWNHVGAGSVYTADQAREWFEPVPLEEMAGRTVLELGFGNGSLLHHVAAMGPRRLVGVELGDTLEQTRRNLAGLPPGVLELHRGDLTRVDLGTFDVVYCIGVLHHLNDPRAGFGAVLRHTRPGGRFHVWVYAHEGNGPVRYLVEPLRRVASRLPWWLSKYALALPLAFPFFLYAKTTAGLHRKLPWLRPALRHLPLQAYCRWIAPRELRFFHHVAFDQLVARQTRYLKRDELEGWLRDDRIDPASRYLVFRNGNSWKLGGKIRT